MSEGGISNERLYLLIHDLRREHEALKVRHDAMENFIKDQYPQYFAGEVGTIADPALAPVNLTTGGATRADPATCKHPTDKRTRKAVAWQKEGVEYCDDCGAVMQPKPKGNTG